jgi:hypothetical protein
MISFSSSSSSSTDLLLQSSFPWGKYKDKSVAHFLLDEKYVKWAKEKHDYWTKTNLFQTLLNYQILLSDAKTVNPYFIPLCQKIAHNSHSLVNIKRPLKRAKKMETKMEIEPSSSLSFSSFSMETSSCIFCLTTLPIAGWRYCFHPCGHAVLCKDCVESPSFKYQYKSKKCSVCNQLLHSITPIIKICL